MKDVMRLLSIVLFVTAGLAQAQSILWVSECWDETPTMHDQGFIDLLTADGYTVSRWTTTLMGVDPTAINTAARDLANGYDLVIVGRHGGSGYADNDTERALWNGITAPMIVTGAYNSRYNRWKMLNGDTGTNTTAKLTAVLPSDPVFAGVTLDENNALDFVNYDTAVVATTSGGNGTIVGVRTVAGGEYPFIVRWTTGQEYYVGSGQFAGGPRMVFHCGRSGGGDGTFNLTPQGSTMFLNAVYEMSGATFNRKPTVYAGTDHITNIGDTVAIDGTVYDPEGAGLTITWSQIAGPGTATFSNTGIEDPTVSFNAKGTYVLQLEVVDGAITVTDTCNVYVRDVADNAMVAHWDFESLPDPNLLVDVTGHGFDGVYYRKDSTGNDPNIVAGHITGSAVAGDLAGVQYWEIPTSYGNNDPNFNDYNIATGVTIAAWVYTPDYSSFGYCCPMIVGNGVNGWRFQVNSNRWNFAYQPGGIDVFGTYDPLNYWHNVVAVYDGVNSKAKIYIDGVLNVEQDVNPGTLLSNGTDYPIVQVGSRGDNLDRVWTGQIDDIQIYNYPLSDAQIAALATEGDVLPLLTAGEDQTVNYTGDPVQLDATLLIDDGDPAPLALTWSVATAPAGVDPNDVIFSDNTIEDPTVTFPNVSGTYILRLTGNDGAVEIGDNVNILILIPTCADVLADGLGFAADLSGPAGTPDCKVDIYDLAALAKDWLDCNNPEDLDCTWPY